MKTSYPETFLDIFNELNDFELFCCYSRNPDFWEPWLIEKDWQREHPHVVPEGISEIPLRTYRRLLVKIDDDDFEMIDHGNVTSVIWYMPYVVQQTWISHWGQHWYLSITQWDGHFSGANPSRINE